jgi:hypothetical protein
MCHLTEPDLPSIRTFAIWLTLACFFRRVEHLFICPAAEGQGFNVFLVTQIPPHKHCDTLVAMVTIQSPLVPKQSLENGRNTKAWARLLQALTSQCGDWILAVVCHHITWNRNKSNLSRYVSRCTLRAVQLHVLTAYMWLKMVPCHWTVYWASSIHFTSSESNSLWSMFILSFYQWLCLFTWCIPCHLLPTGLCD